MIFEKTNESNVSMIDIFFRLYERLSVGKTISSVTFDIVFWYSILYIDEICGDEDT